MYSPSQSGLSIEKMTGVVENKIDLQFDHLICSTGAQRSHWPTCCNPGSSRY